MEDYLLPRRNNTKKKQVIGISLGVLFVLLMVIYHVSFAAPAWSASPDKFQVTSTLSASDLTAQLKSEGYVRKGSVFSYLFNKKDPSGNIPFGTYTISKSMNVWKISSVFAGGPSEIQVVIPPGLRKEEIGAILASKFNWNAAQKQEWVTATDQSSDYFEGVYFPDTYLIPSDSTPTDIAKRLTAHFEEEFAPYAKEAAQQNIKWTTVLKVASLIQREAAGKSDMATISGVIWNRLGDNMKLQIDATVQVCARGCR